MKHKIINFLISSLFKTAFWFRYRVEVKGLENLNPGKMQKPGGMLFLPNHPAVLIDPVLVAMYAWKKVPLRPVIVDYMYQLPVVNSIMRYANALPMPDFEASAGVDKKKQGEAIMDEMVGGLKRGEHFLIYPAGRLKRSCKEDIGGASATQYIISRAPEANIILVRTKGLYGSLFSSVFTGATPPLFPTVVQGIKVILKNLIFFTPRRKVIVEYHLAPEDFPYNAGRLEMNKWLERWYNQPDGMTEQEGESPGDSLMLVSYAFWKKEVPPLYKRPTDTVAVNLTRIDETVQNKVYTKLKEITVADVEAIKPEMSLASDLGLDSLDISELASFLHDEFHTGPIPVTELTTVNRVLAYAAKQIKVSAESKAEQVDVKAWTHNIRRKKADIAEGSTIPEVFLNNSIRFDRCAACADFRSGILTYSRLRLGAVILADKIRKMEGKYIGILLPASVGAYLCVLACQLAGKVPVMINWTIGPRHLQAVRELSKVSTVLTAAAFIDKLENVDLTGISDILVNLEEVRKKFSVWDKLKGLVVSKLSTRAILRHFGVDRMSKDDQAVLLFTSGTEAMPKGVPLSHENILSNARSTFKTVDLFTDDVMLGILPPFHAYGFGTSGIMGLLSGIRSAYYPNPTDGEGLAKAFKTWGATVMSGAPSFIKAMLKAATPDQVKTMRLCVTGAEKAPPELFRLMAQMGKEHCLLEGYGVTECSPIITANRPGKPRKGVGSPVVDVEICIVHPETHELLPEGQDGLVLARGPNVFKGYLNAGLESPFITIDGQVWYNTGDIGNVDRENRLTLSGRKKRFIKIGGEMVGLLALETDLLNALEGKGFPLREDGPSLAIIAKENEGGKPLIILITTLDVANEQIHQMLKELGYSNLVKINEVVRMTDIPIMGTGKVNYRVLEEKYLFANYVPTN